MAESAEPGRAWPQVSGVADRLEQRLKNPHPVSEQNFFDLFVGKTALDQFARNVARVRVIGQVGNKMRRSQLGRELLDHARRQLLKEIFAKVEANTDAIDADERDHMLDMIDIMIDRGLFLVLTDQDRVDANYSAALPDDLDLVIADVALDIVKLARVRMRNDQRLCRKIDNLVDPLRINVGKIDQNAEPLAFLNEIAPEIRQAVARRTARLENPTATGRISPRMRKPDRA